MLTFRLCHAPERTEAENSHSQGIIAHRQIQRTTYPSRVLSIPLRPNIFAFACSHSPSSAIIPTPNHDTARPGRTRSAPECRLSAHAIWARPANRAAKVARRSKICHSGHLRDRTKQTCTSAPHGRHCHDGMCLQNASRRWPRSSHRPWTRWSRMGNLHLVANSRVSRFRGEEVRRRTKMSGPEFDASRSYIGF